MNRSQKFLLKAALGVALAAVATGAAFAAWIGNGDNILMSLYETGVAWCF